MTPEAQITWADIKRTKEKPQAETLWEAFMTPVTTTEADYRVTDCVSYYDPRLDSVDTNLRRKSIFGSDFNKWHNKLTDVVGINNPAGRHFEFVKLDIATENKLKWMDPCWCVIILAKYNLFLHFNPN